MHYLPRFSTFHLSTATVLSISFLCLSTPLIAEDTFQEVESFKIDPGFPIEQVAISGDGKVLVSARADSGTGKAFYWSEAGGVTDLPEISNTTYSQAISTDSDGDVIVGYAKISGLGQRAFRYKKGEGITDLGTLGGNQSYAIDVSSDGSIVVGLAEDASNNFLGFIWTEGGGMVGLPGTNSALGISSDGSTVVGRASNKAYRWTQAESVVDLGTFSGGSLSNALAVNADGSVIVGWSTATNSGPLIPFRWTSASGLQSIGISEGMALGVSDDGNVIVGLEGDLQASGTNNAFRWTSESGAQSIEDWLTDNGVDVSGMSSSTWRASDVSSNGEVIVGLLNNQEIFYAKVAPSGSGITTLADISHSLMSSSDALAAVLRTTEILINGAHSHPMSRRVGQHKKVFWVAGDLGTDNHKARNGSFGLAEIGVGYNYGTVQINASLGKTSIEQSLSLGGDINTDGTFLMLESIFPVNSEENTFVTLGTYTHWSDADIKRGYLNAGASDFSSASSDTKSWAVRARIDWVDAFTAGNVNFTPYSDLNHTEIRMDGYTETGGGFPATFDKRSENITEIRVGLNGQMPLKNTNLNLIGSIEAAHRLDDDKARTSGELTGLFAFDLDGQEYKSTWYKAGIGIQGQLSVGKASLMLNGTTEGDMPDAWLAASYQINF